MCIYISKEREREREREFDINGWAIRSAWKKAGLQGKNWKGLLVDKEWLADLGYNERRSSRGLQGTYRMSGTGGR